MNVVFADTLYWIALTNPGDQWHRKAVEVGATFQEETRLVTTDDVLVEFLTFFSSYGSRIRQTAVRVVRTLLNDPMVHVISRTDRIFEAGLALYEARPDKSYSMVDCMSMQVMRQQELTDVLTHDSHFTQEGFTTLL